jgi:hypothetical protein
MQITLEYMHIVLPIICRFSRGENKHLDILFELNVQTLLTTAAHFEPPFLFGGNYYAAAAYPSPHLKPNEKSHTHTNLPGQKKSNYGERNLYAKNAQSAVFFKKSFRLLYWLLRVDH